MTRFKRCCRLADIETSFKRDDGMEVVVDIHSLRVTFASSLFERGTDEKVVQVFMQHTDMKLTRNIYQKVRDGRLRDALGRLAGGKSVTEMPPLGPSAKGGEAVKP